MVRFNEKGILWFRILDLRVLRILDSGLWVLGFWILDLKVDFTAVTSISQPIINIAIDVIDDDDDCDHDTDDNDNDDDLTAVASISQPIINIATARMTNPTCELKNQN